MKKLLAYISVFIVITSLMLLFIIKNFSENKLEICLKNIVMPEQVSIAMDGILAYDYINIYDVHSNEENSSIYTGNINILLQSEDIEEIGITYNDNEVIMGEHFMKKHYNYNVLGEKHLSSYGEYDVNCIIKGSKRIYYRDLNILQNSNIKNQRIYLLLTDKKSIPINLNNTVENLQYYGINASKYIYHADVINFFKKILILLSIIAISIVFFILLYSIKEIYKKLSESHKSIKYDFDFKEFILNADNFKLILKLIFKVFVEIAIGATILYLFIKFLNIYISYSVDFTSLKSILGAINEFIDLIKYYVDNGFTDITLVIVKFIFIYLIVFVVTITIIIAKIINKAIIEQ